MERRAFAALCVGAAAFVLSTGALAANTAGVSVAPRNGSRHSTFTVSFTARNASGRHGSWIHSYLVEATGPKGHGCRASYATSPRVHAGERVRVRLAPRSHWCAGAFAGHVYAIRATNCRRQQPCPLHIRINELGHFSFDVRK